MEQSEASLATPKFFEMLSDGDKALYQNLRSSLSSHACRNRRGKRLENFSEMLSTIKTFCLRHDDDDWKRCLVCGVCWLPNGIAINTRHLSLLIDKCKSSINGSLQKMGYSTLQSRSESSGALSDTIPLLKNNFNELREWTIRQFIANTPTPQLTSQMPYPGFSPMPTIPQTMIPVAQGMTFAMTPIPQLPINTMPFMYPIAMPKNMYPMAAMATPMPQMPSPHPQSPQMPAHMMQQVMGQNPMAAQMTHMMQQQTQQQVMPQQMQQMPSMPGQPQQQPQQQMQTVKQEPEQPDSPGPTLFDDNDPLALTPSFFFDDDGYVDNFQEGNERM